MKTRTTAALAAFAGLFGLTASALAAPLASQPRSVNVDVKKIGKAIAYPVKKAAGNGSKAVNHGAKSVEYPVRKTGVNVSKTTHKTVKQVAPK